MDKTKIIKLLSNVLEKEECELYSYGMDYPLERVDFDSLKFIRFVVLIEQEFCIEIYDSDLVLSKFSTMNDICQTLDKYFERHDELKKVIITDCDNVLWRGIAGEEALSIDDNARIYQKELLNLYNKGALICICSKNEKENIDEAFNNLDMILDRYCVVSERINFYNKATNVQSISDELNLPIDSFVFVDDSDYELGLVQVMFPEIMAVKAVKDSTEWIDLLASSFSFSAGSSQRTKQYAEQREREREKTRFKSIEEYNAGLETVVVCTEAISEQSERIAELSQRTNQFNLSDSKYNSDEIDAILKKDDHHVFVMIASDKYGDMGIIGSAIICCEKQIIIEAFMISCRVFGRGFENILLSKIKEYAGQKKLYGVYSQNNKNSRYASFYTNNGVEKV